MRNRILQLSVAKLIAPFGPGAVVDVLGESFVTLTAENWPKRSLLNPIDCLRLSSRLGVQRFYGPPMVDDPESNSALGITVARFPSWLFCQACRRMVKWTRKEETGGHPECPVDSGRLVPMRFVAVCRERSHASDIPWGHWVHGPGSDATCRVGSHLRFQPVEGGSPGLSGLEVSCEVCRKRRNLGELRGDVFIREGIRCHGTQPWEAEWRECESPLEVIQRGATSFHYGDTEAAIDIPDVSTSSINVEDKILAHALFLGLKDTLDEPFSYALAQQIGIASGTTAEVVLAIAKRKADGAIDAATVRGEILGEEFAAFHAAARDDADENNFKTRAARFSEESTDPVERQLAALIDSVVLVDRLREVRASIGFKRYRPNSERISAVLNDGTEASWLPAYEGFGEGIFVRFRGEVVDRWASQASVGARSELLREKAANSELAKSLHPFSPQYVALHSFAHALIREFAFSAGYAAAALHERIYADASDYGIFIYTTSTDNEGTLGGLVREGEVDRLGSSLARSVEQLSWCSNDPVCGESQPQNIDGLNLAACHSCLLASETSCDGFNLLLDRTLLVGSADGKVPGLLASIVQAVSTRS